MKITCLTTTQLNDGMRKREKVKREILYKEENEEKKFFLKKKKDRRGRKANNRQVSWWVSGQVGEKAVSVKG